MKKLPFNKYKSFFTDAFLNMLAFAIQIGSQQILLFPILAKKLGSTSYANVIVAVAIMNAVCGPLGGQIGITRQLRMNDYGELDQEADFRPMMYAASLLICLVLPVVLVLLKLDIWSALAFTFITLLSNFRFYIRYYYRVNSRFSAIICQNLLYLAGVAVGILFVKNDSLAFLPLLLAEGAAFIISTRAVPRRKGKLKRTALFKESAQKYLGLGSADALMNSVTLIDKLLIYPLLGAYNLAVYNSGTAMSKLMALITNPLNEVILVRLSKNDGKNGGKMIQAMLISSVVLVIISALLMLPVILGASYILYRQFFDDILPISVLLALTSSLATTSSIMRSFVIRYVSSRQLMVCYLINLVVIGAFCFFGAQMAGIIGFAWAMVIARLELFCSFVVVLLRARKNIEIAN